MELGTSGTNAQYVLALGREATPLGSCLGRGFPHAKGRAEQSNQTARVTWCVFRQGHSRDSAKPGSRPSRWMAEGRAKPSQGEWGLSAAEPERSASRAVTNRGRERV